MHRGFSDVLTFAKLKTCIFYIFGNLWKKERVGTKIFLQIVRRFEERRFRFYAEKRLTPTNMIVRLHRLFKILFELFNNPLFQAGYVGL